MMMVSRIAPRFPSCRVSTRSSANAVPRAAATRRRGFRQRHAFLSSISASLGPLGLSTAVYELKEPPNAELGQPLCLIRHGVDLREFLGEEIEDAHPALLEVFPEGHHARFTMVTFAAGIINIVPALLELLRRLVHGELDAAFKELDPGAALGQDIGGLGGL